MEARAREWRRGREQRQGHDCKEEGRDCDAMMKDWKRGYSYNGGRVAGEAASNSDEVIEREQRSRLRGGKGGHGGEF